ncbi:hypothetical protein HMPREF7215_1802 [Pyramidobacter piscolens W5455]|uniref:Uncharacterized protein n=1 Tax=Pyramidobacter piscolens W5455 TaxID=352165 RepID=A0ABP2HUI7_9BACT|nr:hypothetical protein HMPREF7215_1802 [Pyramidobacter piscolens W5455]
MSDPQPRRALTGARIESGQIVATGVTQTGRALTGARI